MPDADTVAVESRARRRIRQAVESRGYTLVTLDYEAWYNAGEKSGIGGGWYGELDRPFAPNTWPGNDICGLSVEETLAYVDQFVRPPEPCDCPEEHPLWSQTPVWSHTPSCRWHIPYHLRWWSQQSDGSREANDG